MVLVPSSSSFVGPPPRKMYSIKSSVKLWLVLRWVLGREQSSFTYLGPVYQFSHLCISSPTCVSSSPTCVSGLPPVYSVLPPVCLVLLPVCQLSHLCSQLSHHLLEGRGKKKKNLFAMWTIFSPVLKINLLYCKSLSMNLQFFFIANHCPI